MSARPKPGSEDRRRELPSVDALLRSGPGRRGQLKFGRPLLKDALSLTLKEIRGDATNDRAVPDTQIILARALGSASRTSYGVSAVINATGVLLHTGLGRAPLPIRAAEAAARAAVGYSDLEVDRETGERGRRTSRAETMVRALTGAEDALVVNNNAAALLLALAALATKKDVLVSRGELIEIGGEFRLPDIMAASGARLVEVGTTNRTRAGDYRKALGPKTGLILKVHPSNYRVVGFTNVVPVAELAALAQQSKVPLLFDVGSGLLDRYPGIPKEEPAVREALEQGADLVSFSGDKLLGGPQAGIVAGRSGLIGRLRRHPMARAVRVDKMQVAALESVLRLYATGRREEIPLWQFLASPQGHLFERARALASCFKGAKARKGGSVVGGGTLPGYVVPSAEVAIPVADPAATAARLRNGRPPVFCRADDRLLVFDLRTVPPESDDRLVRAVRYALGQA
jgi:L-seryl-tRNA(Ser) seleniumtransferase